MISERPEPAAPPGLPAEVPETLGSPDSECPETGGLDRERLAREPGERRRELLDPWLRQVAAAALGVGAARLDAGQPLSAYGLDSLAAVEVQSRLQTVLGVEVAIVDLLAGASLDDLAAAALAKIGAPAEGTPDGGSEGGPQVSPEVGAPALALAPPPAAEGPATGRFPLAPNQQALWFIHRLAPQGLAYHLAGAARVESPIDRAALGRALAALVARHPALRTSFAEDGEGHWQEVCERGACELLELAAAAPGEEEAVLIARLRAAAWRPFDLERGPLLRVGFLPDARPGAMSAGLLFLAVHHIVADFWSLQVMVRDLGALYARESRELPESRESWPPRAAAALPPLGLRYTDFARRQRQRLARGEGERLWHHWRQALGGAPPARLALPVDRPWPKVQTWPGAAHELVLPEALTVGLEGVGRARGATLFMVLLAGFQALLARTTGTPTVTVGAPTHGRSGRGGTALADLVGYFVNLVPLVAAVDGEATFAGLLAAVRAAALAAYEHQEMPLAVLAERLLPERDPARSPLFDVVFAFEKGRETRLDLGGFALGMPGSRLRLGDILLSSVAFPPAGAPFALSLVAAELGRGLGASFRFNTDLFDRATVVRLAERFRRLLAVAVAAPERRLAELPLLAPAERHQLLAAWNDTVRDYPRDAGLAELFAAAVVRAPEAVALVMDQGPAAPREAGRAGPLRGPGLQAAVDATGAGPVVITYGELDRAANRLANHLAALGVRAEDRVAVCLPRSPRLIVALLACVKAGAAYVPLDPAYPAERLAWLLADSGAAAAVTVGEAGAALPAGGWSKVDLDDLEGDAGLIARSKAVPFVGSVGGTRGGGAADRLFCLLYTSGSTGTPKAVALVHRGVARLALGGGHARLGPDRVLAHLAPITFDAATFEIWCALANGARLVILPPGVPSLDGLGAALARHRVTTLFLTTALFHEMVEQNLAGLAPVEELFTGGDVVSLAHLERAAAALPGTRLFDAYGPTEDTTYATCWPVVPGTAAGSPPIGRPVAATEAYVLDRAGGLVPPGSAGELALAGDGLARGYWNRPELTAERFRPHPFSRRGGERVYLTGDSVRHRPDGNLQFLGRVDRQVKVRGFRVEPGEIEAALATHPGVAQSIVVVREDRPGDRRLVAYAVPRAGESAPGAPDAAQLRRHLAARLPAYLLPSSLVLLAALPVTAHGKVDRRALPAPAPDAAGTDPDSGGGAPHTPLEVILAGIWEEVLGVERVGLHDNFFALGGHSLLAARLMSRARHAFGVELPLAALFEEPTLAGFAARLAGALGGGEAAPAAFPPTLPASGTLQILPQARPEHPSLSFAQERLWFLDQLEPGSVTYSIPAALRLHGELAWAPLAGALTGIVARHEVLRTRFPEVEGQPVQRVEPPLPVPLPVVDLARLGAAAAAKESARLAAAEAAAPFALAAGPLLRARLLALGAGDWLLLLSFHHIVFDGA